MRRLLLCATASAVLAGATHAEVVGVEITGREPVVGDFGKAGAYERISGRVRGELDPADPNNAIITDLALAPRNARGKVEYAVTFQLARPVDPSKASGMLVYQVPNRGGLGLKATGDADGRIMLISGWQGDIMPREGLQTADAPVARNPDGSPVTGPVLVRIVDNAWVNGARLGGGIGAPVRRPDPVSLDARQARLIKKRSDADPGQIVPPGDWAFATCPEGNFPENPDPGFLCVRGGFDPAYAYELTYTGKDPQVLGVGFAATRDVVAFFRRGSATPDTPNPVAGQVKWAIGVGVSQSGNFLRSFLHLGFNQAEDGQIVFDGLNPQIAARHTPMNFRFAVPGGAAGLYEPGSEGPLWWSRYDDAARGRGVTSLLDRCTATNTCPKIAEVFGSAELWGLRMSPDLIGTDGKADIPLPANVRRYYMPSTTHGGGLGDFRLDTMEAAGCALARNPNPMFEQSRAVIAALQAWVAQGKEPPASRYPTLAAGDLVEATAAAMGFPTIPGAPTPDGKLNPFLVYDFGQGFDPDDLTGVMTRLPPTVGRQVPSRVPRVDADGNETSGVPSVQARVPLGTYLGWNVQKTGYYAGQGCGFQGGYIPFAVTAAERARTGDPRPSLEERYGTHDGFVAKVRQAAADLAAEGFLLPDDRARIVRQAEDSAVLRQPAAPSTPPSKTRP